MPKIPLAKPFFDNRSISIIKKDIGKILKKGRLVLGPYTEQFENDFKDYIGSKYAVAVNTCTSALSICLSYAVVKGKEVILPSNTFVTVANAIIECGGKVIFAELDPRTLCLDVDDVKKKITKNTRAVIVLHMLGIIDPRIDDLINLCRKKNIFLIEDSSHAHGSMINGRKAGTLGDAACFSFYPTKVMTTALGGMITTNNQDLYKYAKSLRFFGSGGNPNEIINTGNDWLMSEVHACIGISQLKNLDENIKRRNALVKIYEKGLRSINGIKLLNAPKNIRHSYYKFAIYLDDSIDRDLIIKKMKGNFQIETSQVYVPCHLHPIYKKIFGFHEGMLKTTEYALKHTICLPIYPQMNREEVDYVLNAFKKELRQA
ncbi:DegT/DnrJ/EryC1/StrS family aminotransferase [Candidatus Woesearchaeota archaeon]|nr:DegT/DnrJ/EryC1/StrS family aminotransferase [Candidatus Woesearchaeota archaeon]